MSLNSPMRHAQNLRRLRPWCWDSIGSSSCSFVFGTHKTKHLHQAVGYYCKSSSSSKVTVNLFRFNRTRPCSSISPSLQQPMMACSATTLLSSLIPKGVGVIRTFSNNTSKQPPPASKEAISLFQTIYRETRLFLNELHDFVFIYLPVLVPRLVAFGGTLYLTSQYGFNTIACEGPSMEPTIIDGSYTCVLIEKWSHRLFGLEEDADHADETEKDAKIETNGQNSHVEESATSWESWNALFRGIWEQHFASGLQRGDVIILHHPSKESTICKRIIGMPGDTIVRTDGVSKHSSRRLVPPGHLWIEGDNTLNSLDSRSYGTVPASLVIGKVICRLWPLRDFVSLGFDANGMEHWSRISARIDRCRPMTVNGSYLLTNGKEEIEE